MATDGSKESAPAVRTAVELANGTGSELHVAHAVSTAPKPPYPRSWENLRGDTLIDSKRVAALALLERELSRIEELGGKVAGSHYKEGKPEEEIVRLAEELEVGLIVCGGRKVGRLGSLFATSFSEGVQRRARCTVLVVQGPGD